MSSATRTAIGSCQDCGSTHPDTVYWTLDGAMVQTIEGFRRKECDADFHYPDEIRCDACRRALDPSREQRVMHEERYGTAPWLCEEAGRVCKATFATARRA